MSSDSIDASLVTVPETWEELNRSFETKYGVARKIKGPPLDKDFSRLMNFLSDANSTEDDKFLSNIWLDKFNHWRDTVPEGIDSNKKVLIFILISFFSAKSIISSYKSS